MLTLASMRLASPPPSTKVVESLVDMTLLHLPRSEISIESKVLPVSLLITVPPKRMDISSRMAFLLSPKAGAFTPRQFSVPFILFTTNVASACSSISSAIRTSSLPTALNFSRNGSNSSRVLIFSEVMRMYGSLSSVTILS